MNHNLLIKIAVCCESVRMTPILAQIPMSVVFAKEECTQALMDFCSSRCGQVSGVEEEAENSEDEE
jgi:hypothetical protein